jgi:hypothetical protein
MSGLRNPQARYAANSAGSNAQGEDLLPFLIAEYEGHKLTIPRSVSYQVRYAHDIESWNSLLTRVLFMPPRAHSHP